MLNANRPALSLRGKIRTRRSLRRSQSPKKKMTTYHIILKIYLWVGMENLYHTGFISSMASIFHTTAKFAATTRTKAQKHFNVTSPSGDTLTVCGAWGFLTRHISLMLRKSRMQWHCGRNSNSKSQRKPSNLTKKRNLRIRREML